MTEDTSHEEIALELSVREMTCAACTGRVERLLMKQPGVHAARALLVNGRAHIVGDETLDAAHLAKLISDAGYPAEPVLDESETLAREEELREQESQLLTRRTVVAAALTLPIFLLDMIPMFVPPAQEFLNATIGQSMIHSILFVLSTAVLAGPGRDFYTRGWKAARSGSADMNTLVMIGTGAAWIYSTLLITIPSIFPEGADHPYFEAAAMIVTLILIGRMLEHRAKGRASAAIDRLVELQPRRATLVQDDKLVEVPIASLVAGDVVSVTSGDRIPVDGHIVEGETWIDRSMLNGEPLPVSLGPGDKVEAATVNVGSPILVEAEALGADTVMSRVLAMVRQAQAEQPPIQRVADAVVAVFVPIVLAVSVFTFTLWMLIGGTASLTDAIVSAVSVLIIACPCAMGLATPVSVMVSTGRGARAGVLFRRASSIEKLANAKVLAFDKTGTLTLGKPEVVGVHAPEGQEQALLVAAASVEQRAEHPLARAIVAHAQSAGAELVPVSKLSSEAGGGLSGIVNGDEITLGNMRFLERRGVTLPPEADDWSPPSDASLVYVVKNGEWFGTFALADTIREGAKEAMAAWKAAGYWTVLLSGDLPSVASSVAEQLGMDEAQGGRSPEDKAVDIAELQKSRGPVAFFGDGINDAPALATADVGVAMGSGTEVAMESGEVVLLRSTIASMVTAVELSRATLRNIHWNLVWAFGYNILLIPVAAGILIPFGGWGLTPMMAAGAMSLSSLFVLGNALRLTRFRPSVGEPEQALPAAAPAKAAAA